MENMLVWGCVCKESKDMDGIFKKEQGQNGKNEFVRRYLRGFSL